MEDKIKRNNKQYLLSSSQQRYWLMSNYYKDKDAYNMSLGMYLSLDINYQKLKAALIELVKKTDILNVTIQSEDNLTFQTIQSIPDVSLPLFFVDLTKEQKAHSTLEDILKDFLQERFDLKTGPLWRLLHIIISPKQSYLYLVMHHIICDALSFQNFFRKLSDLYLNEENSDSDDYFFNSFLADENIYLNNSNIYLTDKKFWNNYLPSSISLPLSLTKQFKESFSQGSSSTCLQISTTELFELQQFAANCSATLYIILLAGYFILLSRSSGLHSICAGTMVSGREVVEKQDAMGCFSNILPVYYMLQPELTINEFLQSFKENIFDLVEHARLPFQIILEDYCSRHTSHERQLFDSLFILQQRYFSTDIFFNDPDAYFDERDQPRDFPEFPLFFLVRESNKGLFINIQFDQAKFDQKTIEKLACDYRRILLDLARQNKIYVGMYLAADEEEVHTILNVFNDTKQDFPKNYSCYELFENQAKKTPDSIAIHYLEEMITYEQLKNQVEIISTQLLAQNINLGEFVGICLERKPIMIAAILGILRLGCAYVPFDANFPKERLKSIFLLSNVKIILCSDKTEAVLSQLTCPILNLEYDPVFSQKIKHTIDLQQLDFLQLPCYRLFTSGSTGIPKAVTIFQENLLNLIYWAREQFKFDELDAFLAPSPITFDVSVLEIFAPLSWGGKIILVENTLHYHEIPAKEQVVTLSGTPSAISKLIQQAPIHTSVKYLFLCGESTPLKLVEDVFRMTQINTIINAYGLTELTVYSLIDTIHRGIKTDIVTIGKPISNTRAYVLNEFMQHVPLGVIGDIYIAGRGVPHVEGETNKSFSQAIFPEIDAEQSLQRMLKTGDKGYFQQDGKVVCLGRSDNQIKLRGYRIDQEEIETIMKRFPSVTEAVVCLKEDSKLGGILVGYYTSKQTDDMQPLLEHHLRKFLPNYMVPSFLIKLDLIPSNRSGKIDRKYLTELPMQLYSSVSTKKVFTFYEKTIKSIWQDVLGCEEIQLNDSFFLLGGHSLLILQVSLALEEKLHIKLSIADFFMYPILQELAAYVENEINNPQKVLTQIRQTSYSENNNNDIAIIGVSCRLSGVNHPDEFWQTLNDYKSMVREVPEKRWDWRQYYHPERTHEGTCVGKWGTFIDDVDLFDPSFFNLSLREAKIMDPQQRLMLELAWEALESAGYSSNYLIKTNQEVGVYIGASIADYARLLSSAGLSNDPYFATGNSLSLLANRISYLLGLSGPSLTVDTACSSAFTALHLAVQSLRLKETDLALVGSVALMMHPDNYVIWSQMGIIATRKDSAAFDANSDGFIPGEGAVCILLKPLEKAIQDRDTIHGVVKGTAINHDGSTKVGLNATSPKAQCSLILKACDDACLTPLDYDYIETHGTGTQLGDAVEIAGLSAAFASVNRTAPCPIGSVKPLTGHTGPVAGLTSLMKVLLAFKYHQLPATKVTKLNPNIPFKEIPFFVNEKQVPWKTEKSKIVGISAFGFAGSNAHIILTEHAAEVATNSQLENREHLFVLSAKTQESLTALVSVMIHSLQEWESSSNYSLTNICYTLGSGREHFSIRLALIVRNLAEVKLGLENWLVGIYDLESEVYYSENKVAASSSNKYLSQYALSYINGNTIDFDQFYKNEMTTRVPLPTYQFKKISCWYQEDKSVQKMFVTTTPQWLHIPMWLPSESIGKRFEPDCWVIFVDNHGIALAIIDILAKEQKKFLIVYCGTQFSSDQDNVLQLNITSSRDYEMLFDICKKNKYYHLGIIHAWSLIRFPSLSENELSKGIYSLHLIACAIHKYNFQCHLKILTNNTQSVLENDSILPLHATLWGFARSLRAENSQTSLQLIDLDKNDFSQSHSIANRILLESDSEEDTVYRKGERYVASYKPMQTHLQVQRLKRKGTYLIVGGFGQIGIQITQYLIEHFDANVILVGRHLDSHGELFKRKENVLMVKADVTDLDDMKSALSKALNQFDSIQGIFHLAGILEHGSLIKKSEETIRKSLSAKLMGSIVLSELAKHLSLDFLVFFSSISALIDSPLLSDYAAANAFQNSFASYLNQSNINALCLCWCGWSEIGLGVRGNSRRADRNIFLVATDQALQLFNDAMHIQSSFIIIANPKQFDQSKLNTTQILSLEENVLSNDHKQQLTTWLTKLIANITELPEETLIETIPFMELGIDSILSAQLTQSINSALGTHFKPILFYEIHTISKLVSHILNQNMKINSFIPIDFHETKESDKFKNIDKRIAIIGASCVFSGAQNFEEFWRALVEGQDCVSSISYQEWREKRQCKNEFWIDSQMSGGFIFEHLEFDHSLFGISSKEAQSMHTQEKLLLHLTYKTIENAGYVPSDFRGRSVGIFIGTMSECNTINFTSSLTLANYISRYLQAHGPSLCVETLCSSSLVALHLAVQNLREGKCEYAIVGGIRVDIEAEYLSGIRKMKALSSTGKCRAFSAQADGFVPGEGGVVLLLTSAQVATKNKNSIWGYILGTAINHGGQGSGFMTPNPRAHKQVIQNALSDANIDPSTISYIEAHGTGTELGDPLEIEGLTSAFVDYTSKKQFCAIGSVKTNIGHTEPVAGLAGVIKVILAMRHRFLPKSLHLDEVNPHIDFDQTPFFPIREAREWVNFSNVPRRAGVSAFGIGGSNAHVILEESDQFVSEDKFTMKLNESSSLDTEVQSFSTRQVLRELLATHLLIPIEDIDDQQMLISLGADSLTMSGILSYLSDKYDVKIRMVQLFEELTTIDALAEYIDSTSMSK